MFIFFLKFSLTLYEHLKTDFPGHGIIDSRALCRTKKREAANADGILNA